MQICLWKFQPSLYEHFALNRFPRYNILNISPWKSSLDVNDLKHMWHMLLTFVSMSFILNCMKLVFKIIAKPIKKPKNFTISLILAVSHICRCYFALSLALTSFDFHNALSSVSFLSISTLLSVLFSRLTPTIHRWHTHLYPSLQDFLLAFSLLQLPVLLSHCVLLQLPVLLSHCVLDVF